MGVSWPSEHTPAAPMHVSHFVLRSLGVPSSRFSHGAMRRSHTGRSSSMKSNTSSVTRSWSAANGA